MASFGTVRKRGDETQGKEGFGGKVVALFESSISQGRKGSLSYAGERLQKKESQRGCRV